MDPRNLHVVDHVKARLTVFIAPAFINEIEEGIKLELDEHLYRCGVAVSNRATVASYNGEMLVVINSGVFLLPSGTWRTRRRCCWHTATLWC